MIDLGMGRAAGRGLPLLPRPFSNQSHCAAGQVAAWESSPKWTVSTCADLTVAHAGCFRGTRTQSCFRETVNEGHEPEESLSNFRKVDGFLARQSG